MFTCHGCTRHVLEGSRKCPFCGVTLRASISPTHGGFMGAILGLALVGCGDPDPGDEEGASSPATTNSTATAGNTTGESTSVVDPTNEAEAADYGGPEADTTIPPEPSSSSGTDTGTTTDDPGSEAEGADYGGPESTGG